MGCCTVWLQCCRNIGNVKQSKLFHIWTFLPCTLVSIKWGLVQETRYCVGVYHNWLRVKGVLGHVYRAALMCMLDEGAVCIGVTWRRYVVGLKVPWDLRGLLLVWGGLWIPPQQHSLRLPRFFQLEPMHLPFTYRPCTLYRATCISFICKLK